MDKDGGEVTSLTGFKDRLEKQRLGRISEGGEKKVINQVVTPIQKWEVQICANEVEAYESLFTFDREEDANKFMKLVKIRLVQKATLAYEDNERKL